MRTDASKIHAALSLVKAYRRTRNARKAAAILEKYQNILHSMTNHEYAVFSRFYWEA